MPKPKALRLWYSPLSFRKLFMRPHRLNNHTPPYLPSSKTHVHLWSGVEGGCGISEKRHGSTLTQAQVNGLTLNLTGPGPSSWTRIGLVRTGWDERLRGWGLCKALRIRDLSSHSVSVCEQLCVCVCVQVITGLLPCVCSSETQRQDDGSMD